ncbi:hypothetical protein HO173_007212 [Letharia columbiana]|uniref:Uncharacterized protein n=1 Tax=Letharia columbiana TaxID=112416 RepID=A0A8H6FTV0_9LECA|nr:uncharacterized protein HO173_007212 [Letharia columbiana]KAF6234586.1 hypothetical protein HO173_007212 [Letharia columbiana]
MEGKNLSAASRKSKTISSLDTPYTHVQCLLSPIGEHRSRNVASSKGKRAKKRKREDDPIVKDRQAAFSKGRLARTSALAQPEIHDHLTVGFNTTTRYLERLAQKVSPSTDKDEIPGTVVAMETSARPCLNPANIKPLAAVFVPRSGQPPVLYSHLPLLTKAASLAVPSSPSTRIISLPEGTEAQLKTVLGIPRVGMVGLIDGAPDASSLIELIRQNVPELEVPWFREAVKGAYLAVKINTVRTGAPLNPKRGARSSILAMAPDDGMWYDKRR